MDKAIILKIVIILAVIAEAICTPLFLRAQKPGKSLKSLGIKMICASMFMVVCFCSLSLIGESNFTPYIKYIVGALIFGWFGDLFLHMKWLVTYIIGGLSFMTGHVFYMLAYLALKRELCPGQPLFATWEIITIVSMLVVTLIIFIVCTVKLPNPNRLLGIPFYFYECVLTTMWVSSLAAFVTLVKSGMTGSCIFAAVFFVGATLFKISDDTIIILDGGMVKNYPLKCVNIGTYFAAQTLLALSIALYV